jgi:hypothetical protein
VQLYFNQLCLQYSVNSISIFVKLINIIFIYIVQLFFNLFQNNATPNNTPLQPLNGDSPGTLTSAVDGIPSNPGSKKRPSDTPTENSRKKIKTGEEDSNQVWNICVDVGN